MSVARVDRVDATVEHAGATLAQEAMPCSVGVPEDEPLPPGVRNRMAVLCLVGVVIDKLVAEVDGRPGAPDDRREPRVRMLV
eukprot:5001507-Prymnesium_polylepis.1